MVKLFIQPFIDRLKERVPRSDWPETDSEFWAVLEKSLVISGATEDIADEASMRLALDPPPFLSDMIERLKKHIGNVCRDRHKAGQAAPNDSLQHATDNSKDCSDCGGQGLTSRFRHNADAPTHALPCYCFCEAGRWIEKNHREKSPDIHRKMLDLNVSTFLKLGPVSWSDEPDNKHCYRREAWDFAAGRPKGKAWLPGDWKSHVLQSARERVPTTSQTSAIGIPAGLTATQEAFLFQLTGNWRHRFNGASSEVKASILAEFADSLDPNRIIEAVRRLAVCA